MTDQIDSTEFPEEDFTSDLIGATEYGFEELTKRNFLPWHRPRKHFVREKQWAELLLELVTETPPENRVIKYLGLPGDDLLDLRHFHDAVCLPNELILKYLGFNKGVYSDTDRKVQVELSIDEVNRLQNVDNTSLVIDYDFTSIAIQSSAAWEQSSKMGPFDVINIDLCESFAKHPSENFKENHYNSLANLMALQARRPHPWLLLLTTRTNTQCVDDRAFKKFQNIYAKRLLECENFLNASLECFSVNDDNSLENYCSMAKGYSDVFLVSLCLWILQIGLDQNPASKVEVKNVFGYKVNPSAQCADLISVAIKVNPTFSSGVDQAGIAIQMQKALDRCVFATRILKRISKQQDVDEILSANSALLDEMINATIVLLEQARYDTTSYKEWLQNNAD